jgi:hypothetical protein
MGGLHPDDVQALVSELLEEQHRLEHDLRGASDAVARLEATVNHQGSDLRGWNELQEKIDAELHKARENAVQIEREARERAARMEGEAQERGTAFIDRVCGEASAILEAARVEARDLFARSEAEVADARGRVERLTVLHSRISGAIRMALQQFERGLFDLGGALPGSAAATMPALANPSGMGADAAAGAPDLSWQSSVQGQSGSRAAASPTYAHRSADASGGAGGGAGPGGRRSDAPGAPALRVVGDDEHSGSEHRHADQDEPRAMDPAVEFGGRADDSLMIGEPVWAAEPTDPTAGIGPSSMFAPTAPVTGVPGDAKVSPSRVVVEIYPLHEFPQLTQFERTLGELNGVVDVYVNSFEAGVAQMDVTMERPGPLSDLLRRSSPLPVEVDDRRPEHLMVRVRSTTYEAGTAAR